MKSVFLLSLAIGIGALTAVLTTGRELLFRDPPYPHPERLVAIDELAPDGNRAGVALQNLLDFREQASGFEHMAAFRLRTFGLRTEDPSSKTRVIQVGMVTWEFFATLGVDLARGRSFTLEEEIEEAPVLVVTSPLAGELGGKLLLNEEARTIVGVLPEHFRCPALTGDGVPDAYIPLSRRDYGGKRAVRSLLAIGRLRDSVSLESGRAELGAIAGSLASVYPDTNAEYGASLVSLKDALGERNVRPVAFLAAGSLALLAIVLTNLGSLAVARLASRRREMMVRVSLGACPRDLFALVFAETIGLTLGGAVLGLALGAALLEAFPPFLVLLGGFAPMELALAPEAFYAALFVALVTAVLAAAPALRSASVRPSSHRLRRALVVTQVALAVLLLETVGLFGRSFVNLVSVHPGFDTERAYSFGIGLPEAIYDSEEKLLSFHETLLSRLRDLPRVEAAGAGTGIHLSRGIPHRIAFQREGEAAPRVEWSSVSGRLASPGYFEALGVPLLRGRTFSSEDRLGRARVVIVNRAFEEAYFSSLGKRLALSWQTPAHPEGSLFEIVGVVADTKQTDLSEPAEPEIVLPLAQHPSEGAIYVLRTSGPDPSLGDSVRAVIDSLDGRLQTVNLRALDSWVRESVEDERLSLVLASILSGGASALAALGIYGILAYWVEARRSEIALRMALGADGSAVRALVAGEGLKLTLLGLGLGVIGIALSAPVLRSQLFDVSTWDGVALAGTLLSLALVAAVASWAPSRRAARLSPMETLRDS